MDRRSFLQSAPAAAALAIVPSVIKAAEPETPIDKVTRLGWELAHALNEYADGRMHAIVHPTDKRGQFALGFVVTDLGLDLRSELRRSVSATKQAMETAYPDKSVRAHVVEHESGHATIIVMTE